MVVAFWVVCLTCLAFVSSSFNELIELSQQFISTSTFLNLASLKASSKQTHGFQNVSFYYISDHRNTSRDVEFLNSWITEYGMPFDNFWIVYSLQYSTPFEQIGIFKSRISALSHFFLQNTTQVAVILSDNLIPIQDPSLNVVQFQTEIQRTIHSSNLLDGMILSPPPSNYSLSDSIPFVLSRMGIQSFLLTSITHCSLLEHYLALNPQLCNSWTFSATLKAHLPSSESRGVLNPLRSFLSLPPSPSPHGLLSSSSQPKTNPTAHPTSSPSSSSSPSSLSSSSSSFIPHTLIPKNILMISIGESYTSRIDWPSLSHRLLTLNPDYHFILYTDKEIEKLWDFFPILYKETYDNLPIIQWKSDFVRYLLLYLYGGVYIDVDILPVLSFERMAEHCLSLPIYTPTSTPSSPPTTPSSSSTTTTTTLNLSQTKNLSSSSSSSSSSPSSQPPLPLPLPQPGPLSFFFMLAANEPDEITNSFLTSPQHHPFYLSLAQKLISDQPSTQYGVNVKRLYIELKKKWESFNPEDSEYGLMKNIRLRLKSQLMKLNNHNHKEEKEEYRQGEEKEEEIEEEKEEVVVVEEEEEWSCVMRERRISPNEQRYVIRLDQRTIAMYGNGKRNWPPIRPSSSLSSEIYLSS